MSAIELVIHHDDLGASHSANVAFGELWNAGLISSGSVMVPCPWFPEIAAMARERPDYDLGVHLTLTSEFDGFRWRPLTGVADNGLTDPDGFMWRDVASAAKADPIAVEMELRAQIDTALAAGIDVTHIDTHMMALYEPQLIAIYEKLGIDYQLPIVVARSAVDRRGHTKAYAPLLERLTACNNPVFDTFPVTPFANPLPNADDYRAILEKLGPGRHYGAFHFAAPGDMEMISEDASTRTSEYRIFRSGAVKTMLAGLGITMTGMRQYRDRSRGA